MSLSFKFLIKYETGFIYGLYIFLSLVTSLPKIYKSSVCLHQVTGLNKFSSSEIPKSEYLFVSAVSMLDISSIILDF